MSIQSFSHLSFLLHSYRISWHRDFIPSLICYFDTFTFLMRLWAFIFVSVPLSRILCVNLMNLYFIQEYEMCCLSLNVRVFHRNANSKIFSRFRSWCHFVCYWVSWLIQWNILHVNAPLLNRIRSLFTLKISPANVLDKSTIYRVGFYQNFIFYFYSSNSELVRTAAPASCGEDAFVGFVQFYPADSEGRCWPNCDWQTVGWSYTSHETLT